VLAHHNLNAGCFVCWSEALKCFEGLKRFEKFLKKNTNKTLNQTLSPFPPFSPAGPPAQVPTPPPA
jgi:hypothetical protein